MLKMAVFAGNPGREFRRTRHNIGWMLLESISRKESPVWKSKFKGTWAPYRMAGEKMILLKPETYMNKIGESIQAAASFFKLEPEEIIIVHDDLELDFGKCLVKKGGGAGGHNGLRSADRLLGTNSYYRLRLGISRPSRGSVSSYVLGRFSEEEEAELDDFMARAESLLAEAVRNTDPGSAGK